MKHKCDHCDRPATHHSVEVTKGKKIVKHLCELHAIQDAGGGAGVAGGKASGGKASGAAVGGKGQHKPIGDLVGEFVKQQSGAVTQELTCEECGLTFSQFKESSLLGCPSCYKAFEAPLDPLLERAHEGGTHHLGKVPHRAGTGEHRQAQLLRMRRQLGEAVAAEDYERAARLRDEIRKCEGQPS